MKKRLSCFLFALIFAFSSGTVPAGAIEIYVPDGIDGSQTDIGFYTETSELISRYWEDDYFDTLFYKMC